MDKLTSVFSDLIASLVPGSELKKQTIADDEGENNTIIQPDRTMHAQEGIEVCLTRAIIALVVWRSLFFFPSRIRFSARSCSAR